MILEYHQSFQQSLKDRFDKLSFLKLFLHATPPMPMAREVYLNGTGSVTIHLSYLKNFGFDTKISSFQLFLHITPSHLTLKGERGVLKWH